jgi:hypothetical protein
MIQVTGNLKTSDGLLFENPLININLFSPSKFQPVEANLLIGSIKQWQNVDDTQTDYFKSIYDLLTLKYNTKNTDFLFIESLVIADLELLFTNCTFEQI